VFKEFLARLKTGQIRILYRAPPMAARSVRTRRQRVDHLTYAVLGIGVGVGGLACVAPAYHGVLAVKTLRAGVAVLGESPSLRYGES